MKRLQGGETADVLILNRAGIHTMTREGCPTQVFRANRGTRALEIVV